VSDSADDLLRAAKACAKSGNHEESISLYRQYVELRPRDPFGWSCLAYQLLALRDGDGAIAALREALRLKPDYASAHALYGFALERKGEVSAAIAEYRAAIEADLVNVHAFENLARLHLGRGELKEAERVAREGRRSWPEALEMRRALADILVKRKRWREASAEYEAIAAKCPDDHDVLVRLGWVRERAGDFQAARTNYERALALRPEAPETLVSLSGILRRLGKLDEAEAAARHAISLSPGYVTARVRLASLLCRHWRSSRVEGYLQAARSEIEEAMALAPDADAVLLTWANIEWYAGNWERSLELLEQGARRRPELACYHGAIILRSLRQGMFGRAWKARREFLRVPSGDRDWNFPWAGLQADAPRASAGESSSGLDSAAEIPDGDANAPGGPG